MLKLADSHLSGQLAMHNAVIDARLTPFFFPMPRRPGSGQQPLVSRKQPTHWINCVNIVVGFVRTYIHGTIMLVVLFLQLLSYSSSKSCMIVASLASPTIAKEAAKHSGDVQKTLQLGD